MGKFDGKLLVSDMDATLLNSVSEISAANREAIEYFMSEGGRFTVASGRMVHAVRFYFDQMRINAPAVLYNGAKLYDYGSEKTVHEEFIEDWRKPALKRVYENHPEFGLEVYSGEIAYVYRRCFETERFLTKPYKVVYEMPDEVWDMPWTKALIIGRREDLDGFEPIYRARYDKGLSVRSGDHYLDLVSSAASKGAGVRRLAALLGIERENIYAAGDNMNDIDMLRAAGHAYAVANAEPAVKAAADEIVPGCDEDAIAYIIESLLKSKGVYHETNGIFTS